MITIRVSTDVKDDRRVVLTLPPEVPLGKTELIISITPDEPQGPQNAAIEPGRLGRRARGTLGRTAPIH